jgi:putative heme iron utilization protein
MINDLDDFAKNTSRHLLSEVRFASLATLQPGSGHPLVTRIALVHLADFGLVSLISDLAGHSKALRADPRCSLLIGQPKAKGDPLTHPRLSVTCSAELTHFEPDRHQELRQKYLEAYPKSKLYIDFGDFQFVQFKVLYAALNGGFGKTYVLEAAELATV